MSWNLLILVVAIAQASSATLFGRARGRWLRLTTNLGLGVVMNRVTALVVVPMVVWAAAHPLWPRPPWLSGWLALAIDFVLLDAVFWLRHWVSHNVPLLWRFHAVHHMDEHLDMSTGLRSHPGDRTFAQAFRACFIMVLAIPAKDFVIAETFAFAYGLFTHMDHLPIPRWIERTVGRVLVLPGFHVVHHTARLPHTDTNYGHIFCVWDRLAGTTHLDRPHDTMRRGLDDLAERGFLHMLIDPFVPSALRRALERRAGGPQDALGRRSLP